MDNSMELNSNIMALPCEVLVDIFSRLALKHIHQLQIVSKLWFTIISSPQFRLLYNMKSMTRPRALLVQVPDTKCSPCGWNMISRSIAVSTMDLAVDSEIENEFNFVDVIAHENNFFVVSSNLIIFNHKVCNPTTKEIFDLPISSYPPFSFNVGYILSNNTYKVVHLFSIKVGPNYNFNYGGNPVEFQFETLTLKDGGPIPSSWQSLAHKEWFSYKVDETCVNDVMYWLVGRADGKGNHIISMKIENEELLSTVLCPEEADDNEEISILGYCQHLADINGELCLAYHSEKLSKMDLFLLKDHKNQEWVKEYTINLSGMGQLFKVVGYVHLEGNNGDIIIEARSNLLYNIEKKRFRRLPRPKNNIYTGLFFDRCFKLESSRLSFEVREDLSSDGV